MNIVPGLVILDENGGNQTVKECVKTNDFMIITFTNESKMKIPANVELESEKVIQVLRAKKFYDKIFQK